MNWRHRPPRSTPAVFRFLFVMSRFIFRLLFGTVHPPRDLPLPPTKVAICLRIHVSTIASLSRRGYPPNPGGPRCASPRKQVLSCPQRCSRSSPSPVLLMDKQSPPSRQRSHLRDLPLHNPPTTPFCCWLLATIPIGASASV